MRIAVVGAGAIAALEVERHRWLHRRRRSGIEGQHLVERVARRIELPWLGGKVVELGRKLGVPTPTHSLMYAALKPYVMGAPQ